MAPTLKLRGHHETEKQTVETRQAPVHREKTTEKPRAQPETKTQPTDAENDPVVAPLQLRRPTADHRDLEKMQTRQDPAPVPTKPPTTTAAAAPAKPAVLVKKTDKIRDFFEKKKTQPTTETRQDPAPLRTAPQTIVAAPAAPAKSAMVAKTEERGGKHETKTERAGDRCEMKTQATETRQDPAPPPPKPSPAAQQTTITAAATAAAAPEMSTVMAKAAVKSQSNHANVLERYNRTGDRQRYADVSERNPFRSVSPLRKPTRKSLEGWSGHQMNTSDWPPEKPQEPEVKEASEPAAAAQEPSRRPSVQKVRGGKGIHTPVEEITKIWHKIRRDDDTKTNQDQAVAMSNVPPTREDDETAEKMERAKQEDELKKKFWEKLDRTLGLHQVRPHDDRNGDKKRREKGRLSLLIAKVLIGLMGLSFFGWLVTMVALIVNQKSLDRLEFILWPVLTVVGLVFSGSALVRAQENVDSARYDEEIARQREVQVERVSRGLGPEIDVVVGDPSKNQQQLLRAMGGVEGPGSNAVDAVPEAAAR